MMATAERTVLCPVDFTPLSERALRLAVAMCRCSGARLVLEHNLDARPPGYLTVGWMWSEEHETAERDRSARAEAGLRSLFDTLPEGVDFEARITHGPLDTGILYLAKNLPAHLIVMGTHGPSNAKHQSTTERIILRSPCPVLAMGEGYDPEAVFDRVEGQPAERLSILVPFDFTARSRASLAAAASLVRFLPHRIHLLHCAPPSEDMLGDPEASSTREKLERRLAAEVPPELADRVETRVINAHSVGGTLDYAEEVEALFILMVAHGKSRIRRLLFGDTTLGILHGSRCPIWFVPVSGRHEPIWTAA